jgi:hypothetical protein
MPRPDELSRRLGLALSVALGVLFAPLLVVPATAGAYATIEGPPIFSSAPGLPDGRVYEQVSPADKNGNEAGATNGLDPAGGEEHYAAAAADGNSVLFEGTGPMGEVATAINPFFIAVKHKGAAGWSTHGITPAPQPTATPIGTLAKLQLVDPSADLSHVTFLSAAKGTYASPPNAPCGGSQLYLSGSDPFMPATWLERPEIEEPIEECFGNNSVTPAGGTPNFSTVYFGYAGTLLPEDASRAPHIHPQPGGGIEAWGFYEDREGSLREAGVLPDGGLDQFGALPLVGVEGSRAFFVSPDPGSCEPAGHNDCTTDPPELYVRENGEKTLLISQDTLLPDVDGLPAAAPSNNSEGSATSFLSASPDGSQVFFQSEDQLTSDAPEGPPGNTSAKTYDFDVDTGTLTYLPDVVGQIVATDADGSSFAFVRPAAGPVPTELDLWSAGPGGGSVTPVTQLPGPPRSGGGRASFVSEGRMSSDGGVLVFVTATILPDGFNSGGVEQIYHYDASANTLGCVSCPPHGVTPTGNAAMSPMLRGDDETPYRSRGTVGERGISADGSRVFFDTPDPLVPQDTNTTSKVEQRDGIEERLGRDVYEWENGVVYLISGGKSPDNSDFLDNSKSGDDVFFATTESLVPGDTDGGYDVYDVRVPHPGDNPPPAAVPCEGSVCQGPPNVPSPLTPPASATFSGLGNPAASEPEALPAAKPKPKAKATKCRQGYAKKKSKCVKQTKAKKRGRK